ncbi:MAG TPA: glycoside hydrolase family 3 N-terminal domain-containing protein [Longimicrobiales bacterium]
MTRSWKCLATLSASALALSCSAASPGLQPSELQPARFTRELSTSERRWVERSLARMTLQQKIGQLLFPRITGAYMPLGGTEYERVREWIVKYGVGGVIVTIGPPLEMAAKLNSLQQLAALPLLVSADMEHGPGQTLNAGTIMPYGIDNGGATRFPPLMGLGATGDQRLAYEMGRITATEARAVGVHVTFAPVVDVNNNPENPIINTRSYGADPELVGRMASAHIRGLQDHGMAATAKHFPGHGDTGTDSHVSLPVISVGKGRADSVELPPYRAAIDQHVAGIMTAHIAFPALTGDTVPATLNGKILTGLLRDELDYQGVIFTDAMDMGAITTGFGRTNASVMALKAGADVLLQPFAQDLPAIIDAIERAVQRGEISDARIEQSVRRVLELKARLALHRQRSVSLDRVAETVARPEHLRIAQDAADRSITLLHDQQQLIPLRGRVLSVVYTDDYDPFAGRTLNSLLRTALPDMRNLLIDANAGVEDMRALAVAADSADVIAFSAFIRVRDRKADLAIPRGIAEAIGALAARKPTMVTSFGNPYLRAQFPDIGTYVLAWGQTDVEQRAAARALLGQIPITGKLPISIPPFHRIGEGLVSQTR